MSDALSTEEGTSLGIRNAKWGICGFTSTFYAMYQANPTARALLHNATSAYSVLYEIKEYLEILQTQDVAMIDKIRKFTRSFPGYEDFSIRRYIRNIERASRKLTEESLIIDDPKYSIALPPEAVADYIMRMWKWKATVIRSGITSFTGDAIIGVRKIRKPQYHGLCHYLYRDGSSWYSWGKKFGSLQEAGAHVKATPPYSICYAVTVSRT